MNEITKKFVETEDTIYNLSKKFKVPSEEIIKILKIDGYLYAKPGISSKLIINLKKAADEYISNEYINIEDLCKKYKVSHTTFPKYLKNFLNIKIEKRVKSSFNINYFDSIDTEEKAYWLGFIFADGYISNSPNTSLKKSYTFELSLKLEDYKHLENLKKELQTTRPILTTNNRCRLLVNSKHFWETLNKYGCTPNKSLTLKFPNLEIFKNKELIKHFMRGYFDGDGCISYSNKEHSVLNMQLLGTYDFLSEYVKNLPKDLQNFTLRHNHNNSAEQTFLINTSSNKAYKFFKFLYENSKINLERKYSRFARYHSNMIDERDEIGESCDANTELT